MSGAIVDTGTLRVASGAKVALPSGVNETVGFLYLDGKTAAAGTWGSTSSGATYKDNAHFSGTGILMVTGTGVGTPYVIPKSDGTMFFFR